MMKFRQNIVYEFSVHLTENTIPSPLHQHTHNDVEGNYCSLL